MGAAQGDSASHLARRIPRPNAEPRKGYSVTFRPTSVSRRAFVGAGLGVAASSALRPFAARATDLRFATNPFTLGVASGYPEPNAIVLWTRLAPEPLVPGGGMPSAPVAVDWEIAQDERFAKVVRRGTTYATPDWGHSVHVEATGLEPARDYWYRFTSGGERSAVGRTRTAPAFGAALARLKLAVANCQYYEHGYYAAYRAMAATDLDLVVHVGDYIYEQRGISRVRAHDAPEAFTLDDYRHRYSLYRLDADLQAAHAACPWMVCSDDHEVSNDYAADQATDGEPPELFLARRASASRPTSSRTWTSISMSPPGQCRRTVRRPASPSPPPSPPCSPAAWCATMSR